MDSGSQQSLPPLEVVMFVLVSLVLEFKFVGRVHVLWKARQSSCWPKRGNHVSAQCLGDECGEMLVDWFSSAWIRLDEFTPGQLFCGGTHLGNSSQLIADLCRMLMRKSLQLHRCQCRWEPTTPLVSFL